MKKIFNILVAMMCCLSCVSCGDDDWDYDHSQEHVYFFGPQVWGYDGSKLGNNNVVTYNVNQGEKIEIPMQFWCEFVRSYDVETFYYTAPKPAGEKYYSTPEVNKDQVTYDGTELVCGVDYEIVDAQGNKLSPNSDGAYTMAWPNAKKGVQNIYIKALNGKKGAFNLLTANPNSETKPSNQDVESTVQNKTDKYTVRIFTQNYRVTVVIK